MEPVIYGGPQRVTRADLRALTTDTRPILLEQLRQMTRNTKHVLTYHGRYITVKEAREQFEIPPIIRRFGTWAVTRDGLDCLMLEYSIPWAALGHDWWLSHMADKWWCVLGDFAAALGYARLYNEARKEEAA